MLFLFLYHLHDVYLDQYFFFQAEDGIRDRNVTGVQTCALPILAASRALARTALMKAGPASIRSRRGWAGSCRSPDCRGRDRFGSASRSTTPQPASCSDRKSVV